MKMKTLALALGMSLAFQVAPAQAAPAQAGYLKKGAGFALAPFFALAAEGIPHR